MGINIWCLILMYQHYLSSIPCQSIPLKQPVFTPGKEYLCINTCILKSFFTRKNIQGTLLVPSKSIRKFSPSSLCSTWGQSSWKAVGLGFESIYLNLGAIRTWFRHCSSRAWQTGAKPGESWGPKTWFKLYRFTKATYCWWFRNPANHLGCLKNL